MKAEHRLIKYLVVVFFAIAISSAFGKGAAESAGKIQSGSLTFRTFDLHTKDGSEFRYYISESEDPKPIVVYVQGSGCEPTFIEVSPGDYASTVFSMTTSAKDERFVTMIVDKPNSPKELTETRGSAQNCPKEFNESFTFEFWLDALNRAYEHAKGLPWVKSETLLIGISEGAVMAAALAAEHSGSVQAVALLGATGSTQIYDFLLKQYQSKRSNEGALIDALDNVTDEINQILDCQGDGSRMFWGHPAKRWSSFFSVSTEDLLDATTVPVFLAAGTADRQVPIVSTESLYANLIADGREVRFLRIAGAGHDLVPPGGTLLAVESIFSEIRDWYDDIVSEGK